MPVTVGNVSFFLGPHTVHNDLDDLEAAIIDFIDGAERRLEIAVQELESRPIAEALLRAEIERKVQVRIVLEADYLAGNGRPRTIEDAFESRGKHETNRILAAALMRGRAWVRTDFNPQIFHQKFIIRDSRAVLTGSTNFTPTGVGTDKRGGNLNHVLIVEDRDFARQYSREFREIARGRFGRHSVDRDDAPKELTVSGIWLKPCFAPDHNPEMEIMKQMLKASERIDFAIFTFAQSSGIDDAMIGARRGGVAVRGVLDGMQANQKWAATKHLDSAGCEVHLVPNRKPINKLHHKLMTMDDRTLVAGSFNYTGPANALNDENIVVISGDAAGPVVAAARAEIDRIIEDHAYRYRAG